MWHPDFLEGFECREIPLEAEPLEGEPCPLVATLVRRVDAPPANRAVLYVHGWNDYFFHPHVAEFFESRGCAFYAVDMRRMGRSIREGQLLGFVDRLEDYYEELDAAYSIIAREHAHVGVLAHSAGGLVTSLWANDRPGQLCALMLNSPWLDMHGPSALSGVLSAAMKALSLHDPTVSLPMPELEDTIYARTIHARWGGEWDYNLEWKLPIPGPIRVGWLRAIFAGQSRVEDGLSIDCPVFVATSASTVILNRWSKRASHSDSVLDVDRITAQAWRLGRNIHIVRVKNGLHDLFLSPPEVRGWLFDQIAVWLDAYVPEEAAVQRPWYDRVSWGRRLRRSWR